MGTNDLIHDQIWTKLEGLAAIRALVGSGAAACLYRGLAPNGAGFPHIHWQKVGGGDENDIDKEGLNLLFLISAVSKVSPKQAETLSDHIKTAMHKQVLTVAGFTNIWTRVETHFEGVPFNEDSGKPLWQAGRFVRIRFAA